MTRPTEVWARSPQVAFVQKGDRVVILDLSAPGSARPHALVGPAALIWNAVAQPGSLDAICSEVESQLSRRDNRLRGETATFLQLLRSQGLVMCTSEECTGRTPPDNAR